MNETGNSILVDATTIAAIQNKATPVVTMKYDQAVIDKASATFHTMPHTYQVWDVLGKEYGMVYTVAVVSAIQSASDGFMDVTLIAKHQSMSEITVKTSDSSTKRQVGINVDYEAWMRMSPSDAITWLKHTYLRNICFSFQHPKNPAPITNDDE